MEGASSMILYQYENSVCAQKVRITLAEKKLEWEAREVDLFKSEQYDPEYLKLNPKGVVPTLIHEGRPINESTLICEYLDEVFPDPPLIPEDPYQRTQVRLWSKMVDEGLHEGVTEISFSAMFRNKMKNMTQDEREIGDPRRRDRFKSTFGQGSDSPFVLYAIAAYEKAFKMLEKTLSDGRDWIFGDQYTLADINLMPYVARLVYLELAEVWIGDRPHVQAWWERVQELPSFKVGVSDLLTVAELAAMAKHGPVIRDRLYQVRASHLVQMP
jgi:glutathione S-transferase